MKRYLLVAFAIIFMSIMSLQAVTVKAVNSGYNENNYLGAAAATIDGKWTSTSEWTDAGLSTPLATGFTWMEKWFMPSTDIIEYMLIEFPSVTTANANDFCQVCFDPTAAGGSAPQTTEILFNYTGHGTGQAGLTLYKGTGTGWAKWTGYTYGTDVSIADSITATPLDSTPHWVIELMMDRATGSSFDTSSVGYMPCLRVAVYTSATGVLAWPTGSSQDVPSGWGQETGVYGAVPEKMMILPIVVLSSVAVIVSLCFMRKRPKLN